MRLFRLLPKNGLPCVVVVRLFIAVVILSLMVYLLLFTHIHHIGCRVAQSVLTDMRSASSLGGGIGYLFYRTLHNLALIVSAPADVYAFSHIF